MKIGAGVRIGRKSGISAGIKIGRKSGVGARARIGKSKIGVGARVKI